MLYELVFKIGDKEYVRISSDREQLHDRWEWLQKNLSGIHPHEKVEFVRLGEHRKISRVGGKNDA